MAVPDDTLRCPRCGRPVPRPPPAAVAQWASCPHCSAPVLVAPSGVPPPRFTWEVVPGLYPPQPPLRRPFFRWRRLVVPLLITVAVLTFATMGLTAGYAWQGTQPATYTVDGTVSSASGTPITDAHVVLVDESATLTSTTNLTGGFRFVGVPTGGLNLTVTASGYVGERVLSYVSPGYDAGSRGLKVSLSAGSSATLSTSTLSPYPDLEYFVAYVGSAAAICGIAGVVVLWAAIAVRRADRPAFALAGGSTAVALPFAFYLTSAGFAFPQLFIVSGGVGGVGFVAAILAWIELIQIRDRKSAPPPRPA